MYASIRRYRVASGPSAESAVEQATQVANEQFADRLAVQPGFVGYQILNTGDDTIVTITIFDNEEQCERSNELAAEFVRDELGGFEIYPTDFFGGEVVVSRAATKLIEPAHG